MRLIDADILEEFWHKRKKDLNQYDVTDFLMSISNQKTISTKHIKEAYWMFKNTYNNDIEDSNNDGYYCCSECQFRNINLPNYLIDNPYELFRYEGSSYCSNCGAQMKVKVKKE